MGIQIGMVSLGCAKNRVDAELMLGVLLSGIVQSICPKLREHLYEKEVTKTVDIVIMAVLLFLCTMYLVSSTYNPFIYFRF